MGNPYWYGTFGQTASESLYESKKAQYPEYYTADDFESQYGKRVYDCIGLIKGYLWSATAESTPVYNSAQDVGANSMRSKCKETGEISSMPDIPGVLVFMDGHVGVFVGDGKVIEARGHSYGVIQTNLNERPWVYWGKCPWIEYSGESNGNSSSSDSNIGVGISKLSGASVLSNGDRGYGVQILQAVLAKLGYYTITVDGVYGSGTIAAVKKYQSAYGLSVDGVVGVNTSASIADTVKNKM